VIGQQSRQFTVGSVVFGSDDGARRVRHDPGAAGRSMARLMAGRDQAYNEATTLATMLNSGGDLKDILDQWGKLCVSLAKLTQGGGG